MLFFLTLPLMAAPLKCPEGKYHYEITGVWKTPRTLCLTYQQAADDYAERPGVKVRLVEPKAKAPAKRKGDA